MVYETDRCPVCGYKEAYLTKGSDGLYRVECGGCGLRTEGCLNAKDALWKWNHRPYRHAKCKACRFRRLATWNPDGGQTVRCSHCEKALNVKFAKQYNYCPYCGCKMGEV